jgi:hypothetical protein
MDMKTFGYLYYKTRGYAHDDILKNAEITEEEYEFFEKNLQDVLKEIETLRPVAENIGQDFVRLTRYIYERESDQTLGVQRPETVKARVGEIESLLHWHSNNADMPLAKQLSNEEAEEI